MRRFSGWTGCSRHYEYPAKQFNADYGEPLALAKETAKDSGIFVREWSVYFVLCVAPRL
jgi:hypothetical protein